MPLIGSIYYIDSILTTRTHGFFHDTLTVFLNDSTQKTSGNSILTNNGFYVVLGALIAALTSFFLMYLKEKIDKRKEMRREKERIFTELSDVTYRLTRTQYQSEICSLEQDRYLALINASQESQTRELYMFMYRDAAEKYAFAFKEYLNAFSAFNKLIASYVLLSNDYSIAEEIRKQIQLATEGLEYPFDSKDINDIKTKTIHYYKLIDNARDITEGAIENVRSRVYTRLGFKSSKENQ